MLDCEEYHRWMRQAVYTLNAIRADVEYGAYSWACFKAQQAAEIALKALLKALGKPAFGHNLVQFFKELAEHCGGADSELALCIGYLDKLYIPPRCPDAFVEGAPYERFTPQEAEMAAKCAERVVRWVEGCSPCRGSTR